MQNVEVNGIISGELPPGQYMWLFQSPEPDFDQWWPQGQPIVPKDGKWHGEVWLSDKGQDIGRNFKISAILVDEKDSQFLNNYLDEANKNNNWYPIPLPKSAILKDNITVIKKE